jgi:hypothetical protein
LGVVFFLFLGVPARLRGRRFQASQKGEAVNLSHHRYLLPPRRRAFRYNNFWLNAHRHSVASYRRQRNLRLATAAISAKNHFRFNP